MDIENAHVGAGRLILQEPLYRFSAPLSVRLTANERTVMPRIAAGHDAALSSVEQLDNLHEAFS